MDEADQAQQFEQKFLSKAMDNNRATRMQFTAKIIEGEPCCQVCEIELEAHRVAAGICISCLEGIEAQRTKRG